MTLFDAWSAAFKRTADEAVMYAVQVATRHAQRLTAMGAGIPKFWRPFSKVGKRRVFGATAMGTKQETPAQAQRQHLNWLKYWILGVGLPKPPRRGMSGGQFRSWMSQRMSESERKAYFEVAKKEQGALAAGFSPAIKASGKKPVAAYISRHGNKHGSFRVARQISKITATVSVKDIGGAGTFGGNRGSLRIFAEAGVRRAELTMQKAVEAKLMREFAKMQKQAKIGK